MGEQEVDRGARANQDLKEIGRAKKYGYDPAVITVKQGDRVKLIVTAVDHDMDSDRGLSYRSTREKDMNPQA